MVNCGLLDGAHVHARHAARDLGARGVQRTRRARAVECRAARLHQRVHGALGGDARVTRRTEPEMRFDAPAVLLRQLAVDKRRHE